MRLSSCRALAALVVLAAGCGSSHPPPPPPAPNPGTWQTGTPLPVDRFEAYAAALNGKIYYIGGITGIFGDARSIKESLRVDVFDPATNQWTPGTPLPADAPHHHLAVAVFEGKAYVLGGFQGVTGGDPPGVFYPIATSYSFDGTTWTKLADQPLKRGAATAQVVGGQIYVVGGGDNESIARNETYAYDPHTDTWAQKSSMTAAREHVASCTVAGKLVAAGGWAGTNKTTIGTVEIYDPQTDAWTQAADMPTARGGLGAVAIGNVCYFIGGENWQLPPPGTFPVNEGFDITTGRWFSYASMPTSRHGVGVALLGGLVYAVGGGPIQGNSYTNVVEIFTP